MYRSSFFPSFFRSLASIIYWTYILSSYLLSFVPSIFPSFCSEFTLSVAYTRGTARRINHSFLALFTRVPFFLRSFFRRSFVPFRLFSFFLCTRLESELSRLLSLGQLVCTRRTTTMYLLLLSSTEVPVFHHFFLSFLPRALNSIGCQSSVYS